MSEDLLSVVGKRILVTGASSGFGQFFALELARRGADVALGARRAEPLQALAGQIAEEGGRAAVVVMDVTSQASVAEGLAAAEAGLGGALGVVVNNAGVAPNTPFLQLSEADWDSTLDTNLKGAFNVSQVAARRLAELGEPGSIINIASILGVRVAGNVAPYCASKAGLLHLTKSMALELARFKIRVNAIAPGYVETDINRAFFESESGLRLIKRIPQRQLGQMRDLLGPLLLLASDASGYMTGATLAVDGGHLVSSL